MYHLEYESEHAYVIINALDLLARIHMGQIGEIRSILSEGQFTPEQLNKVAALCDEIKEVLGFAPGASFGIYNEKVPRVGRVAWDIQSVIRQVIARTEKHGAHSVWLQDPMHSVADLPLPTCWNDTLAGSK